MPDALAPTPRQAPTRDALLGAARALFAEVGYDRTGVREIASRAGVDGALVHRYFGSKRGLFEAAVAGRFAVGELLVGDRATLGERLARWLVGRPASEPTRLLLRAAPSAEAAPVLRAALEAQVARPLAGWLGGADAEERAGLVVSLLFGVGLARDLLGVPGLAPRRADALVRHLAPALQALLNGRGAGQSERGRGVSSAAAASVSASVQ